MKYDDLKKAAQKLGIAKKADVFAFNADVEFTAVERCIKQIRSIKNRQPTAIVILTTEGGSADDGYRLARAFQRNYERFIVVVLGLCKSAGTLITLGAHEVAMGEQGELGPLDVQVGKQDELTLTSGMVYYEALEALKQQSFDSWEDQFLSIKNRSGGNISTKTAADIAMHLTCGLFSEIARQIDPFRLGEFTRACNIATEYGERLHADEDVVKKLAMGYSHHGFVIDRKEAADFIDTVRELDDAELEFESSVEGIFRMPVDKTPLFGLLYSIPNEQKEPERSEEIPVEQLQQKNGHTNAERSSGPEVAPTEFEVQGKLSAPRKLRRIVRER